MECLCLPIQDSGTLNQLSKKHADIVDDEALLTLAQPFFEEWCKIIGKAKTLETLDPKERLNVVCKLMPYIFPKVETVHPTEGEPLQFGNW